MTLNTFGREYPAGTSRASELRDVAAANVG
jgi:hypothetical protein